MAKMVCFSQFFSSIGSDHSKYIYTFTLCMCAKHSNARLFAFHHDDYDEDDDSGQFCVLIDTQALHLPNDDNERKMKRKRCKQIQ